MRILFATSEVYPLIKTGGLADVSYSLPLALQNAGHDIKIVLPFYRSVKHKVTDVQCKFKGKINGFKNDIAVYQTLLSKNAPLIIWLVDVPELFDREGGPYTDAYCQDWKDSAFRFAIFSRVISQLGNNLLGLKWLPDIVHCNDWQTGLAIPLLQLEPKSPATLFTIHNLSYQGNFSREVFQTLLLPKAWWSINGIEFYGDCSFLKAGVLHADRVNTVSPSYAKEITTPEKGERFDGLLRHCAKKFTGILNGVDLQQWNPETDPFIKTHYSKTELILKTKNKKSLQRKLAFPVNDRIPVFGMVCRLVYQKGIDLLIDVLPELLKLNIQVVILGSGDTYYEEKLLSALESHHEKLSVNLGYNEPMAHKIEASADFFLMPSRYEPCGLNQIISLRYGTLPIVRNIGGLADTVVDSNTKTIISNDATGFVFEQATASDLMTAISRAIDAYGDTTLMNQLRINAMSQEFSWE